MQRTQTPKSKRTLIRGFWRQYYLTNASAERSFKPIRNYSQRVQNAIWPIRKLKAIIGILRLTFRRSSF